MKKPTILFFSTLIAFFLSLCLVSVVGSTDNSLFPIGKLQASLTASEGQGTVVAIHQKQSKSGVSHNIDDDYVLILSRSPRELACNLTRSYISYHSNENENENENEKEDRNGSNKDMTSFLTPIAFRGAVKTPFGTTAAKGGKYWHNRGRIESKTLHILHEQAGLCIATTGFLADVRHLVRYVASAVSEHEYLYGGGVPSVHSLVRDTVSSYIRDATTAGGSRPFGVQALLIGNNGGGGSASSGKIQIFALDPSGNFRHCIGGIGTIGKNAEGVRRTLCDILKEEVQVHDEKVRDTSQVCDIEHSLYIAMKSILENNNDIHELLPIERKASLQFEAIVIFGGKRSRIRQTYSCAILDNDFIFGVYRKCVEDIRLKHKSKR